LSTRVHGEQQTSSSLSVTAPCDREARAVPAPTSREKRAAAESVPSPERREQPPQHCRAT